jgi:hypothetical protein
MEDMTIPEALAITSERSTVTFKYLYSTKEINNIPMLLTKERISLCDFYTKIILIIAIHLTVIFQQFCAFSCPLSLACELYKKYLHITDFRAVGRETIIDSLDIKINLDYLCTRLVNCKICMKRKCKIFRHC